MQSIERVFVTSQLQRQRSSKYYKRMRDDPEFMLRNKERAQLWRAQNLERARETTRLCMQRLRLERKCLEVYDPQQIHNEEDTTVDT